MAATQKGLDDAGEKIGGARKDQWAVRGMTEEDLASMSGGEQAKYVSKDAVWPKPDFAALIAGGMEPKAAALLKGIRDSLAAKPLHDTPEERLRFVSMMGEVRRAFEAARTPEDLETAHEGIHARAGFGKGLTPLPETKARFFSVMRVQGNRRKDTLGFDHRDEARAQDLLATGFPSVREEPWLRGIHIVDMTRHGLGFVPFRGKSSVRGKAGRCFPDAASAEAWLKEAYESRGAAKDQFKEPDRPHLDKLERNGPDHRRGRDVGSEDFVRVFGFRGVEFGNWVANDERQKSMNAAFDGLMDLAEVMKIEPKAVSLDGRLGLAFGSRGSGRFAAHYEPAKEVINLTKLSGAGSLAHEWAHALDHFVGERGRADAWQGDARGASGWRDLQDYSGTPRECIVGYGGPKANKVIYGVRPHRLEHLPEPARKAIDRAMEGMTKKDWTGVDGRPRKVMSDFYREASHLCGKSGEGYWTRPTELFARSFETWAFDRLQEQGRKSDYLVHGVEADRYADKGSYKGNPYPVGEERVAIHQRLDDLGAELGAMLGRAQPKEAGYDVLAGKVVAPPPEKPPERKVAPEPPRLVAVPPGPTLGKGSAKACQLSLFDLGMEPAKPPKARDRGEGR